MLVLRISVCAMAAVRNQHGEVKLLMVKFENPEAGKEVRRCHPLLARKFPGCTPISKQVYKYSTAKRSSTKANIASVSQFALILAISSTTHKIQAGVSILQVVPICFPSEPQYSSPLATRILALNGQKPLKKVNIMHI